MRKSICRFLLWVAYHIAPDEKPKTVPARITYYGTESDDPRDYAVGDDW